MNVTGRKKRILRRQIHQCIVDHVQRAPEDAAALAVMYADRYAKMLTLAQLQELGCTLRIMSRLLDTALASTSSVTPDSE